MSDLIIFQSLLCCPLGVLLYSLQNEIDILIKNLMADADQMYPSSIEGFCIYIVPSANVFQTWNFIVEPPGR